MNSKHLVVTILILASSANAEFKFRSPSAFSRVNYANGAVRLSWDTNGMHPIRFDIYRSLDGGLTYPTLVATAPGSSVNSDTCGAMWYSAGPLNTTMKLRIRAVYGRGIPILSTPSVSFSFPISRQMSETPAEESSSIVAPISSPGDHPRQEVTLLTPNGGEELTIGQEISITWQSVEELSDVKLYLSRDSGVKWREIEYRTSRGDRALDGDYVQLWTVTGPVSATCFLKIVGKSAGQKEYQDVSDESFTILKKNMAKKSIPSK